MRPETAVEGGLIAYGPWFSEVGRQQAPLLVKVLRGAKPADLPVEQPFKLDLVINLKTAKALGLEVPPEVLALADQAIEWSLATPIPLVDRRPAMRFELLQQNGAQRTFALDFATGDEVVSLVKQFVAAQKIFAAEITALGGLSDVMLLCFD